MSSQDYRAVSSLHGERGPGTGAGEGSFEVSRSLTVITIAHENPGNKRDSNT